MEPRLKNIIFRKLYEDLSHLEIILYKDKIWVIDIEKENWYFLFDNDKILWWRLDFFTRFFGLFSLGQKEFEPILSEYVEILLKSKICATDPPHETHGYWLEFVSQYKVESFFSGMGLVDSWLKEVLFHMVELTPSCNWDHLNKRGGIFIVDENYYFRRPR